MPALRVRVLGGFEVDGVDTRRLGSRKARTVIKALALARGNAVPVEALYDAVWPEGLPAQPPQQLSVLVSRLRATLGAEVLVRRDAGYAVALTWLDLDAVAGLVDDARRRLAGGARTSAAVAAAAALKLWRGPLLPEDPEAPWAEADRALALRLRSAARTVGAEAALASGDVAGAALLAQSALDDDGFDENALRTLMTALACGGRPASALAAYATVRARLADELGVSPTPETEALHDAIVRGHLPEGSAPAAGMTPPTLVRSPVPGPAPPGREEAVAALDEALDAAREGAGGLVSIVGEPGMGKTHLAGAWAARIAPRAAVLTGRCDELSRGTPLRPVVDALEEHLRTLAPDEIAVALGPDAELIRPFMAAIADGPMPPAAALRDWGGAQLVAFAAIVAVLGRLRSPTVLVMDDVHLAGPATLEWLDYAARRAAALALLIVVTQRPEEAVPLSATTTIVLGPLDEAAASQVVGAARARELVARSAGNPLFLVELAAAEPEDGLPRSIRESVAARVARAGDAVATTLRTAAVIGADVDLDLLATVLRAEPVTLLDHLEAGTRRGLLVDEGGAFAFRHQLIRDALAEDTTATRRALTHREVARALAARADRDAYAVALHARLGGEHTLAVDALLEAARLASARFDQAEALALADAAVDAGGAGPAHLLRARVRMMRSDHAGAIADAAAAAAHGAGAEALELQAWAWHYLRDFGRAARLADDGVARAERDGDDDARSGCLTIGGWTRQAVGDLAGAEKRLVAAHDRSSERWRLVSAMWLGGLRVHQGHMEEGLGLLRPAMRDSGVAPWGSPTAHALLFGAQAYGHLGRPLEALSAVDAIEEERARTGIARWAGRAENTRGWILRNLGHVEEADECNRAALEHAAAIDMQEAMSHAHLDLAAGAILRGDLDGATRSIAAARALGDRHALTWRHRLRADVYAAQIALSGGDLDGAMAGGAAVVRRATDIGVERHAAMGRFVVALARRAAGEPVDLDDMDDLLDALGGLAGLEAWRLTADAADAFGVDRWRTLAARRAEELAGAAGPYAERLRLAAGERLDRTRRSTTRR